ncbi:MAG: glyoxalase [Alphaproteobacteria bacterium]|nr:MAG: glyoxalase [Alphaproteobacteria bacterium]
MDAQAIAPQTRFKPPVNAAVWFEIPVTDMDRAKAFYAQVLMTELRDDNTGPNPMAVFAYGGDDHGVSGHLYPGRPAPAGAGPTIHLPLPDSVENGMERLKAAGGRVLSPVIDIPAGRFAYCLDPDGNSIGLFSK